MKTVRLGRTELRVSRIGFGGIPIQRLSEDEAIRVVQHSLDLGVTFIDTANGYTTSEERIGKAIAGRRDEVIIATKTGARDGATAREHLELSLARLDTDAIDIWQLHGVSDFETYEHVLGPGGTLETAREAQQSGEIRHIGITSHSLDVALEAVASGLFETIQFPFNFVTNEAIEQLLPLAKEHDVGFIAMKPIGGGMLEDANLAIKWLLQFETVVPDPGIEKTEEIEQIVDVVSGSWELTHQDRQAIEAIREEVGTRFCRRCQYCMPCPQGVRISTMMVVPSLIKRLPPATLKSDWIMGAVQTAEACIECGECEAKCPYHLPIREMIAENIASYEAAVLSA
jgi:predicted aldo/keto reductase-like oxidoreductase